MILSNYHTHTTYCDGKDSVEAMILRAIELGCAEIGFSGHSTTPFDPDYCMSSADLAAYKAEVRALGEKYKDRIKVLLGIEEDYYSNTDTRDFDYVIGSVHYVLKNGEYIPVDFSREKQLKAVEKHYGGDYFAFAEDYFRLVGDIYERKHCNIIGHFDLIAKFNENGETFDKNNVRYITAAMGALDRLRKARAVFEVNTGAMSRGYRKTPYPDNMFLPAIAERGMPLLVTSDCHKKENLIFGLTAEQERLESAGYRVCLSSGDFLNL